MFHPLFGEQLPIVRYNIRGKQPQVVLQTDEGLRFVPEWMTDPLCSRQEYTGRGGLRPHDKTTQMPHNPGELEARTRFCYGL
ncbi:MAG: hypothetical protein R6U98_24395 [Pirellulaceae bacterium]